MTKKRRLFFAQRVHYAISPCSQAHCHLDATLISLRDEKDSNADGSPGAKNGPLAGEFWRTDYLRNSFRTLSATYFPKSAR